MARRHFSAGNRILQRFRKDRSGNFAVATALMFVPIIAAIGFGVDIIAASNSRAALQNAADTAALAAAGAQPGKEEKTANDFLVAHLGADAQQSAAATAAGWISSVSVTGDNVEVNVSDRYTTAFMKVLGITNVAIGARAKAARNKPANPFCILILDPVATEALKIVNANTFDSQCGIQVNSKHSSSAFALENNYKFAAPYIGVSGKSKVSTKQTLSPPPTDGVSQVPDPLAGMAEPSTKDAPCTHTSLQTINSNSKITINPGVYCGGLTLNTSDDVTMKPGIYAFRGGPFTINASAKVIGKGVQLHFQDEKSAFLSNSAAIFELSAPTSGSHAGILMFQGRKAENSGVSYRLNTAAGSFYEGTIYLPYAIIDWNVSGSANQSASYTALIARMLRLYISGTVTFRTYADGSPTPLPAAMAGGAGGIRLVE